jgi:GTP-binding protein YchF
MEAGIVGLPFVGKTTLFTALTGIKVDPAAAAVKPHVGVAQIPDQRLDILAAHIPTKKIVHATMQLVHIAGLVRGSAAGAGGGNRFLNHIQGVDALIHVVRCFQHTPGGATVAHVEGSLDPARDIDTVESELILADLQTVESSIPKAEKSARARDAAAVARLSVLQKVKPLLEEGRPARLLSLHDPEEIKAARGLGLLSAKKVLYVANVDDDDLEGAGPLAGAVRERAAKEGMECVCVCARLEAELNDLSPDDRREMLASLGMKEPALGALARAAYRLLGLMSFYTAGPKEIRAWTIHVGETAPQAAGAVHSDIQRGFIKAEIYSVDDLAVHHSEQAIKHAGKWRSEGKNYVMRDGDVVHFLFNV